MPTNLTKYIVAANGTIHLRNNASDTRRKSYCGRVQLGADGVKGTNKVPTSLCGRCTQLSDAAAAKPVADKPAAPVKVAKGTKAPRKAVRAATAVVDAVTVPASDPAASLKEGIDEIKLYELIDAFIVGNNSAPTYGNDMHGTYADFEFADWTYRIWAAQFNPNGPDEGWTIIYRPVEADPLDESEDVYVDGKFATDADVIDWIAADTGFSKAKGRRPKKAPAKPAAKPNGNDTQKALVTSHLVTIASNAKEAATQAAAGKLPKELVSALNDLMKAADALRRTV